MAQSIDYSIWSQEDLNSYFQSTFVGVEDEKGNIQPVYVSGINRDAANGEHCIVGRIGRNDIVCKMSSDKFHVLVPSSTYVNVLGQTMYCSRKTLRQYKKGVKRDQYVLEPGSRGDYINEFGEDRMPHVQFDKDIVFGLFNKKFPTFAEALDQVKGGERLSCAFCDHFAVGVKLNIENPVLLYKGLVCGQINGDSVELCEGFTDLQEKLIELMG